MPSILTMLTMPSEVPATAMERQWRVWYQTGPRSEARMKTVWAFNRKDANQRFSKQLPLAWVVGIDEA